MHAVELSLAMKRIDDLDHEQRGLQKNRKYWKQRSERADGELAAEAADAREARTQMSLAERATRSADLLNLNLRRQLVRFEGAVPLTTHTHICSEFEAQIAQRDSTIAELGEQLAELERADAKEGGEDWGEEGGEDVWRVEFMGEMGIPRREALSRRVPPRAFVGDATRPTAKWNWAKASTRHIAAVLQGRPMSHVLTAITRLGRRRELTLCREFAPEVKFITQRAVDTIEQRWDARMSVHIWDRLSLSRSRMDDLRHLLSFVYDPVTDKYDRYHVWVNPNDGMSSDTVDMPRLVGRAGRETLFSQLADASEITVGDSGRCERDAIKCATQLYVRFSKAMRSDFSIDRPARPVLYFDGTGGSLGKGVAHAELGSADFTGDCKQSRSTLSPLALYEGNDHALPLRSNLSLCMKSFVALSDSGEIHLSAGECIPCEPIVVGDMQGIKCMMGMTESCHAVWCKCRARGGFEGEGPQHQYGEANSNFETYEEAEAFWERTGCEFKTEDFLLACAHLSKGLFYGGAFTKFTCPDCNYSPTAAQAKADLTMFNAMTDEEQKTTRREHVANGAHFHVEYLMGPMPKGFGMERCGADQLHLIYLNVFKHLFKYTIHESLPQSQKKLVAEYVKAAGFYSYDAADEGDDPVKRWIGREVKRFIHEADLHLPFLLRLSSGCIDVCDETAAHTNAAGEEEMDISDDEFAPTAEQVAAAEVEDSLLLKNSSRWDRFLSWVRDIETPWGDDTDEYRRARALQYCNGARATSRDLLELKPTMASWVPHIACNIAPRQIVRLGDPARRAADSCESFGATAKKTIKFLTCRRRVSEKFSRGYIEQAFRRLVVHADLLHGAENAPYLQRADHALIGSGRMNKGLKREEGPHHCVRVKVEQETALS